MTCLCCENTKRLIRFFKKPKPVHGQKVLPGADSPWSNNNALANDSKMTSSTSTLNQTSTSVVAPPPYREKSEVVDSALHE
ncbi:hypothetical protein BGX30_005460 [Mortierella sp. GBA39]|nr:hypothetical protein BGX30_005460 [Mortierella sp. GBA39]